MRIDIRNTIVLATSFLLASSMGFAATFDGYDTNNDGQISKDEFYGGVSDAGLYEDWDSDDDGLIDDNEFDDLGFDGEFASWDADDDGYLDSGELYDGVYASFDENESGHWENGEWDDAGDFGLFDV